MDPSITCRSPPVACRFLATTQFEPNAARAAFPCFDEPQLKATFQLAMVRHETHTALFNTPRRSTEDLGFYLGAGIVSVAGTAQMDGFIRDVIIGGES